MANFMLHYFAEDTGACKTVIAAELSGVALSLIKTQSRESGMSILTLGLSRGSHHHHHITWRKRKQASKASVSEK